MEGLRNTSSEVEGYEQAQKLWDLRQLQKKEMLKQVLDTYEGRSVLWDILGLGDIYSQQSEPSLDPYMVQRQTGRRMVALEILTQCLEVRSDAYILMQKEAEQFERNFLVEDTKEED